MPLLVSDAIVLHAFDYLESSRILRLATRDGGLRSALAKGARRSHRRFGTALDLFAQGTVQLATRPGREMDTMTGFEVARSREGLAHDLGRFAGAGVIAELVLHFGTQHSDPDLFDAVAGALDALAVASPAHAADATLAGAWRVLGALGFAPVLDACAECSTPVANSAVAAFHHAAGGVLCERCAQRAPSSRRMPAQARAALRAWGAGVPAPPLDAPSVRAHQRLLREFVMHHVAEGRALRAFHAWESGALPADAPPGVAPAPPATSATSTS